MATKERQSMGVVESTATWGDTGMRVDDRASPILLPESTRDHCLVHSTGVVGTLAADRLYVPDVACMDEACPFRKSKGSGDVLQETEQLLGD